MGFWNRVKDVLAGGTTTAVKNERAENAAERAAEEAAERAKQAPAPKAEPAEQPKVEQPKVEVPPQSAPQPPQQEPASEPASAEPEYRTYTVKSGDTLSEIAASYGVDWHEMARLNNLDNPDLIFPGQVFKVPNT
jgi:nucleoid-associated protein YgaU